MSENTSEDVAQLSSQKEAPGDAEGPTSIEKGPIEDPKDIGASLVPYIIGSGICMGTADVVPGVSGGTMAVALGIYRRLLVAIASVNTRSLKALARFQLKEALSILHWRFLGSLLFGVALAVVVMVKVVGLPKLIDTNPQPVYAVFFGLVAGSVVILARRIPQWNATRVLMLLAFIGVGFSIVTLVPVSTPESMPFLFGCGMLAISAMLLPGISGSFVLLILGKYEYVLHAVEGLLNFDLAQLKVVLPFALGCLAGIAAFSRFLTWLMRRWQDTVMSALTGLLIGSLWRIWPYQHLRHEVVRGKRKVVEATAYFPESLEVGLIALVFLGLAAVLGVEYLAQRRKRGRAG
jgi:putative membrane protein